MSRKGTANRASTAIEAAVMSAVLPSDQITVRYWIGGRASTASINLKINIQLRFKVMGYVEPL